MIGETDARGKGYGYFAFVMAMKIGFELLGLKWFYLAVNVENAPAIATYKRAGFEITGSRPIDKIESEYEMKLDFNRYVEVNPMSKKITVDPGWGGYYQLDRRQKAVSVIDLLEVA